ncbi:MAG: sugar transferase [Actinobacteria bacterium]|nr:sugar transferase [Actinomycetota bacterium]
MADQTLEERRAQRASGTPAPVVQSEVRKHRPSYLRVTATLAADLVALAVSALLADRITAGFGTTAFMERLNGPFDGEAGAAVLLILLAPYWLAALWGFGMYREPGRSIGGFNLSESLNGLTALTSACWLLFIFLVLVMGQAVPVAALIVFWLIAAALVPTSRWISRLTVWSRRSFKERVLIIGAGEVGHTLAAKIAAHPEYRIELVGFLDDGEPRHNGHVSDVQVIGALDDLDAIVAGSKVDRVIVAFSRARHNDFLRVVRACADSGVKVNIVPRLFEVVSSRAAVDDVEGIPLLDVGHVELSRFNMAVKRAFDLVVGALLCIPILPVMGIVAIIIKLDSPGPVFYRQERMGRGGKTFFIYKFRSMYVGADGERLQLAEKQNDYDGPMFKLKEDPRITRVGGTLRRWSIDELPQILNVMKGDMSLVGPRPLWVEEAKQCRGWTQKRLDITPGITGLWQVLGRTNIPFDEMVKLDYMYVTGWSLSWDIKLLMETVPAVLNKRGAY